MNARRISCFFSACLLAGSVIFTTHAQATNKTTSSTVSATINNTSVSNASSTSSSNSDSDDSSPFAPYEINYVLPAYYTQSQPTFDNILPGVQNKNLETRFQISVQAQILKHIMHWPISLNFFYTQNSFWQFYAESAYFRETNYNPGIFFHFITKSHPFNMHSFDIGLMHQSNGRGGDYERSWNRVYVTMNFIIKTHWAVSLRPWVRLQHFLEVRDYNPDIHKYLGDGDIHITFFTNKFRVSLMLRNELESNFARGAEELDFSFPLFHHIHGFILAFSGYGQSLISYNHYTNGGGIGISLYTADSPLFRE